MRAVAIALLLCLAPAAADEPPLEVTTVADNLTHPWGMAFLPDGRTLITERPGRLRVVADGTLMDKPVGGVPAVFAANQAGLFDVAPHPDWRQNGWIYLSLVEGRSRANTLRVIRARLGDHRLVERETVFEHTPERDTPVHYGGRLAFLPDGTLLVTLGDGFDYREAAQDPGDHFGTTVRLNPDGTIPADNPFTERDDARDEVFSYGHRNVQGAAATSSTGLRPEPITAGRQRPTGGITPGRGSPPTRVWTAWPIQFRCGHRPSRRPI